MKILFVCHRFPYPPNRGGKIRPFHMIRHLNQAHDVVVASIARSDSEAENGSGLSNHCRGYLMGRVSALGGLAKMLVRLPTPTPSSMGYFYSSGLAREIQAALRKERFDLIVVHCSSVAQYVADVRGIPKLLDFGDMDSEKWLSYSKEHRFPLSLGYWLEGTKLRNAEAALAGRFDFCSLTTPVEVETFQHRGLGDHVDFVPNGVDCEYFSPDGSSYDPDTIAFVGRMDYFPNIDAVLRFCRSIYPRIRERRPGARFVIVGAEPVAEIRALSSLPGVTVTGTVADVRPHVRGAAVTVVPLRIARGVQNKILESLAMGVPVISSPAAAMGIRYIPGDPVVEATTDDDFVEATLRLLQDPLERRHRSESGRERVEEFATWSASMRRFDRVLDRVLDSRPASSERADRP